MQPIYFNHKWVAVYSGITKCPFYFEAELCLEDYSKYRFLSNGNSTIPGQQDQDLFNETMEAFEIMSVPEEERTGTISLRQGSKFVYAYVWFDDTDTILCARVCVSDRPDEGDLCCAPAGEHELQEGTSL